MDLAKELREAAESVAKTGALVTRTRTALVQLGRELCELIAGLPAEEVAAIRLQVKLVTRGGPIIEDVPGLIVEHLPAIDDDQFDARVGATALYLEAYDESGGRNYVEVRSSPGQCVIVSTANKRMAMIFENIHGVAIVDGHARLVNVVTKKKDDEKVIVSSDAANLLGVFLTEVSWVLKLRSRFNAGDQL